MSDLDITLLAVWAIGAAILLGVLIRDSRKWAFVKKARKAIIAVAVIFWPLWALLIFIIMAVDLATWCMRQVRNYLGRLGT